MGCIDAKKLSPDCPSGNFQENMHSLKKSLLLCGETHIFYTLRSVITQVYPEKRNWRRGRRVIMPSGLVLFCSLVGSRALSVGQEEGRAAGAAELRAPFPHLHGRCWAHLFPGEQESSATDLVVLESYVKPSVFVRLHPFTPMTSVP